MFPFYKPWKHQKTFDFLVFLGRIETLARNKLRQESAGLWIVSVKVKPLFSNIRVPFLHREA